MLPIRWNPDRKALAEFSEAGLFALGMVAAPLAFFRGRPALAASFWIVAVVIRLIGLVRPRWLRLGFVGLSLATWPVGWVASRLALGVLYGLVFTPIALIFRAIRRDALARKLDRAAPTYWEPYRPDRGVDRYLRPY